MLAATLCGAVHVQENTQTKTQTLESSGTTSAFSTSFLQTGTFQLRSAAPAATATATAATETASSYGVPKSMLNEAQLGDLLHGIEQNIAILTGKFVPPSEEELADIAAGGAKGSPERARKLRRAAALAAGEALGDKDEEEDLFATPRPPEYVLERDPVSLREYEVVLSELLGIPLPQEYMCFPPLPVSTAALEAASASRHDHQRQQQQHGAKERGRGREKHRGENDHSMSLGQAFERAAEDANTGPLHLLTPLARTQCHAECILYRANHHFQLEEGLVTTKEEETPAQAAQVLASSQALKELQQDLFRELWAGKPAPKEEDAEDPQQQQEGSPGAKRMSNSRSSSPSRARDHLTQPHAHAHAQAQAQAVIHVMEEVNELMHKQRVEQSSHYLQLLNTKAIRRKKMLHSLMNLWQATKIAVGDHNKIPKFASSVDIETKRLLAMPVDEILSQTRSIQHLLVHDMQESASTKMTQVRD
jgi:hypothetical protein